MLWKLYFWIMSFGFVAIVADMFSHPIMHLYMVPVDIGIIALLFLGLISYVFNIYLLTSKFWRFFFRLFIVYIILEVIYLSFPHQPIIQQLSILVSVENKPTDSLKSVFLSWILFLPLFYALFQLSSGRFRKATKPRDIISLGMLIKNIIITKLVKKFTIGGLVRKLVIPAFVRKIAQLSKLKKLFLALGILILAGVAFMAISFWQASRDVPDLERTVNEYLIDASNEDYKHAYGLFSAEYKKVADLATFTKSAVYIRPVYKGYQPDSLATERYILHVGLGQPSTIN
jgi:hypothetical protein